MQTQRMHFQWLEPKALEGFRSGVSLHSHTSHSLEALNMVPRYMRQNKALAVGVGAWCSRYKRETGVEFDFSLPFFTPPLSASEAFRVEAKQIEHELDLEALVSLTDHDSIEAPLRLRMFMDESKAPTSMEWTVPFLDTWFHVGIHNMPAREICCFVRELEAVRCERCQILGRACEPSAIERNHAHLNFTKADELFGRLSCSPDTLIVLNHPLWDMNGISADRHRSVVSAFLGRFGRHIHAIEVNGLRPWKENLAAFDLAERWRKPAVSGGDRHGSEPSAVLNLTRQSTFQGFVHEVRQERRSELVFMKQYREPLKLRKIRTAADLLREYPHHPEGSRRWCDRIYIPWRGGITTKLSAVMREAEPSLVQSLISLILFLEAKPVRPLLRRAIQDELNANPVACIATDR